MSDKKRKTPELVEPVACRSIDELPLLEDYDPMPLDEKRKLKITRDEYCMMIEASQKSRGIDIMAILAPYKGKRIPWDLGEEWKDDTEEDDD